MTLVEEIKNRTHYQDLYFIGVFFLLLFWKKSNKKYYWLSSIHFSFHKQGYSWKGLQVFPLGIFGIKPFILSSKRPQCQGRWFACVSMQLRAWLKPKKKVDTVFGVDAADLETKMHSLSVGRTQAQSQLSVFMFTLTLVSKPKPSPIPHIFQVHSSKFKKPLTLILTFWNLKYSLLHIIQLKQF